MIEHEKELDALELRIANIEEKIKTLEMTVNDIRWGREHPK